MTEPSFQADRPVRFGDLDGIQTLCCPHCGGSFVHQLTITVFLRAEDELAVILSVTGNKISVARRRRSAHGNPSPRRQAVTIEFKCERCSPNRAKPLLLGLAQHKGQTWFGWLLRPGQGSRRI
jgi:hypothetical protein